MKRPGQAPARGIIRGMRGWFRRRRRPFIIQASFGLLLFLSAAPGVAQTVPAKPADAIATPTTPMTFQSVSTVLPGANKAVNRKFFAILAAGQITPGTVARFRALVRGQGITDARILFDSLGGSADEALAFGKAIRALGFDTQVGASGDVREPGVCAAECVYAFAGGAARFFHAGAQRLGIMGAGGVGTPGTGRASGPAAAIVDAFLSDGGVDAQAYARAAGAGPGLAWLDKDRSEMIGIVNNGSVPPTATMEMENGRPMLVIRQQNSDSTAIADFSCASEGGIYATLVAIATRDTANYVTGFTSAYVQFDRSDLALEETGGQAGLAKGFGAVLPRSLSSATAARILTAGEMIIWLRHADFEWGAAITLRFVRPQIAAYFKTCAPGHAAPRPAMPSFDGVASGNGKDLVLAGHHWSTSSRSMFLFDRASIIRTGTSVNLVTYFGARVDGRDVFSISAERYDCVAHTGQASIVYVDRSNTVISRDKAESKPDDPMTQLIGKTACDTSLINQQSVIGDRNPLSLLTRYVDSTRDEYP